MEGKEGGGNRKTNPGKTMAMGKKERESPLHRSRRSKVSRAASRQITTRVQAALSSPELPARLKNS
ncbi:hypothetical protein E2C01_078339 [Portunus trituberculatus]|uniref:Uncharacterized protein n=1 Tax=Portunus trituberculatus TaxID=210409 RepID=A0A5B7IMP8_PORTR|nr:hypothetical protein [Portunus trituberculatus]